MAVRTVAFLAAGFMAVAGQVDAGACDYAPSRLAGKTAAAVGAIAGGGVKAAGYYILVHGGSDLTALTSAATGAGGVIAGAAGAVGAALTAPATIIVGGLTLVALGSSKAPATSRWSASRILTRSARSSRVSLRAIRRSPW